MTGGFGGVGGEPDCSVPLSDFTSGTVAFLNCPPTYRASLADARCPQFSDHAAFGICGALRTFSFGHDGGTTCVYDPVTNALVGAANCNPIINNCFCVSAGVLTSMTCPPTTTPPGPATPPCGGDAGP